MKTKFTVIDRSKNTFLITASDDDTIGEIMDQFFPDNKRFTLEMYYHHKERKIIDRSEILKDILKQGILLNSDVEYHLIDIDHYIDVFINYHTRAAINPHKPIYRIYCGEDTLVEDIERQLSHLFKIDNCMFGLYGYNIEEKRQKVFKLKPKEYVLFLKNCFKFDNFFQYQFNDCVEALKNVQSTFEGKFYKLKSLDEILLFKKMSLYALKENSLVKIKNGEIVQCFHNVDMAKLSIEKKLNKSILRLENSQEKWILCSPNSKDTQELYRFLMSSHGKHTTREIYSHAIDTKKIGAFEINDTITDSVSIRSLYSKNNITSENSCVNKEEKSEKNSKLNKLIEDYCSENISSNFHEIKNTSKLSPKNSNSTSTDLFNEIKKKPNEELKNNDSKTLKKMKSKNNYNSNSTELDVSYVSYHMKCHEPDSKISFQACKINERLRKKGNQQINCSDYVSTNKHVTFSKKDLVSNGESDAQSEDFNIESYSTDKNKDRKCEEII